MKKILVLGAGGDLGPDIATVLAARPEYRVLVDAPCRQGMARSGDKVTVVDADLMNMPSLERAFDGLHAVVNATSGDRWIIANGTQAVLTAATFRQVRRVVQISTTAVYGSAEGKVSETADLSPLPDDVTAVLKTEAERLCAGAIEAGQSVITLRVADVFGAHSEQWAGVMARRLASGSWGALGGIGTGLCNPIDPEDIGTAVLAAIEADDGLAGAFNIRGPETLTWNAYFDRYNAALGLPALRPLNLNAFGLNFFFGNVLKGALRQVPKLDERFGGTVADVPTVPEIDRFRIAADYVIAKAEKELNWLPQIPFDRSLQEAATWARKEGLVAVTQPMPSPPPTSNLDERHTSASTTGETSLTETQAVSMEARTMTTSPSDPKLNAPANNGPDPSKTQPSPAHSNSGTAKSTSSTGPAPATTSMETSMATQKAAEVQMAAAAAAPPPVVSTAPPPIVSTAPPSIVSTAPPSGGSTPPKSEALLVNAAASTVTETPSAAIAPAQPDARGPAPVDASASATQAATTETAEPEKKIDPSTGSVMASMMDGAKEAWEILKDLMRNDDTPVQTKADGSLAETGTDQPVKTESAAPVGAPKRSLAQRLFPSHIIFKKMPDGGPTVSMGEALRELKKGFLSSEKAENRSPETDVPPASTPENSQAEPPKQG